MLETIGSRLGLSRTYVFRDSADGASTSNTHEWCAPGIERQKASLQDIPYSAIGSWRRRLVEDGRIFSTDISTLPEELRAVLEPQGIRSLLVYPLFIEEAIIGFIGFDECAKTRDWGQEEIDVLRTASGFVSAVCARRESQERLAASEDNFRRFFDTVDDLIIVGDLEGRILYANRAVERKLGFAAEEVIGLPILELHPAATRQAAAEILGAMFRQERSTCPLQLRIKSGGELPVETRVWFGRWNDRDCIFGVSKDLSAEQEALQKFTKLFENNPALMAITTMDDGRFVDVNSAFLRSLGYAREEVIGKSGADLRLFPDAAQRDMVGLELEGTGRIKDVELKIRRKDGMVLDGLFSGEVIDNQGKRYFLTVMVNVSEQAELRRRLETERARLANIIEGTRLGTWEWNVQTGETVFNERWAGIVGYRLADLEPVSIATWEKLAHPEDLAASERLLKLHFSGESDFYEFESRMRHKDGRWVWVHDRGKVIERDAEGRPLRMFGTHADITEKKEMEERIRQIAIRDPLTEIYNRRYVFERLGEAVAEAARRDRRFCVSILDIDHFKAVNDTYGHQAGDFVLREFASLLASRLRPYDLLGRYGGEEFVIVSTSAGAADTARMMERLLGLVRERVFDFQGTAIRFTFSCGVADSEEFERELLSVEAIVRAADRRLYAAKAAGRDRISSEG